MILIGIHFIRQLIKKTYYRIVVMFSSCNFLQILSPFFSTSAAKQILQLFSQQQQLTAIAYQQLSS